MLENISPIDGRYKNQVEEIRKVFNEYNLIKNRIIVEIEWLKKLFLILEINHTETDIKKLNEIIEKFNLKEAEKVKEIEKTTKHDVKAVEYYINEKLREKEISQYSQFVHFACTSEDINNLAYGIMIKQLKEKIYTENCEELINTLKLYIEKTYNIPMLSHTHGQNATPTTIGKELAVFVYRLNKLLNKIKQEKISGKFNGTVGNFNAHQIAYPQIDWITTSKNFVESFNLEYNLFTTQIESHDNICILFSEMKLINNIILDLDSDMWLYISRNYFLQENIKEEVGSSVMPHKINPINFENSMANLKMSNAMLNAFIDNLQISRMQRDLSDSSILRNIGSAFAYSIIAIKQTITGLKKLRVNEKILSRELKSTPEVLAEAIQTILRKNGYSKAYDILKQLTRGKNIGEDEIKEFINKIEIKPEDKALLLNLKPENYLGLAPKIAKLI